MKSKNVVVPIIVILIIAVVAVILIYVVSDNAKTTTISGDTLTAQNLSDYEEKITSYLDIDSEDVRFLYDSSVSVKGGEVQDMLLEISLNYGGDTEYWKVQNSSDGISVTYVKDIDGASPYYTLYDLAAYLKAADDALNTDEYTAVFSTQTYTQITYSDTASYLWNGEAFERVYYNITADCYLITVTDSADTQYLFYVMQGD